MVIVLETFIFFLLRCDEGLLKLKVLSNCLDTNFKYIYDNYNEEYDFTVSHIMILTITSISESLGKS